MFRFILAIMSILAAFASACDPGTVSDGDSRFGGSGNPAQSDGEGQEGGRVGTPGEPAPADDPFPQHDPSCPDAAAVMTASSGWESVTASQPAFTTLQLSIMARPRAQELDGVLAVGGSSLSKFSDAAILIRFADDGLIDARDGSVYDRDIELTYDAGVWYTVVITADIARQSYSVDVARCGEPLQSLIQGAAFRSDADIKDQLTAWGAWSSQSAGLDVATPSWVAQGSCVPATCESLSLECGAPSDGCGGSLSCGSCGSGEACDAGVCVDGPPVAPPSGGGVPGGLTDDCVIGSPLSDACVCGGSVYSMGFCCEEGYSLSECSTKALYIRPGGSGAQDGSDWANALSGLPSSLERDTTYWLGAGSYGSYTFDDDPSGQWGITLRKATTKAHGTDTGWSAAYGSGQAVFGPLHFSAGRYTLDGGEPNGIRTVGQMGTAATVHVQGDYVVLRHVEIDGGLQKSNGTQTAGSCNGSNVGSDYVVFDRCEIHNIADDGLEIHSADHVKVLYSKIHNLHACGTDAPCSGPCYNGHSDGLELSNISDIELIGNMVYDVRSTAAIFMDNWSNTKVYDLVAHNNVFYTPGSSFAVYLHALQGAKFHNNIIWGRTQGTRYGGLAMGRNVTDLEMYNNIILNINYNHMGSSYDPSEHDLDYNLFGMINAGEYPANTNDLVADPRFAGIPMSDSEADHKGSNLTLEDFVPAAAEALDTGTTAGSVPAYDIVGEERLNGVRPDRGVFEVNPQ